MTTVYKVVRRRRRNGELISAVMTGGKAELNYGTKKPTAPLRGTKLLAFKSPRNAKSFAKLVAVWNDMATVEVWEADAPTATPVKNLLVAQFYPPASLKPAALTNFWANLGSWQQKDGDFVPKGTVACDSITLIKRLDGPE